MSHTHNPTIDFAVRIGAGPVPPLGPPQTRYLLTVGEGMKRLFALEDLPDSRIAVVADSPEDVRRGCEVLADRLLAGTFPLRAFRERDPGPIHHRLYICAP